MGRGTIASAHEAVGIPKSKLLRRDDAQIIRVLLARLRECVPREAKESKDGRLRELYLLDSEQVAPRWPEDGSEFISHYEMRVEGVPQVIDKRDIIHFRYGLDPRNHRLGMSPLACALRGGARR